MTTCSHCKRRPTVPGKYARRCRVCLLEVWGGEVDDKTLQRVRERFEENPSEGLR